MGIETLAIIGAVGSVAGGVMQAGAANRQAKREARALVAEGEIVAKNKARETNLKASAQRVSFLNSGFTLEGTPMNILEDIYRVGMEDVSQIKSNYQTAASNAIRSGRAKAQSAMLGGITQSASFASIGMRGPSSTSMGSDIFSNSDARSIGGQAFYADPTAGQTLPWRSL